MQSLAFIRVCVCVGIQRQTPVTVMKPQDPPCGLCLSAAASHPRREPGWVMIQCAASALWLGS